MEIHIHREIQHKTCKMWQWADEWSFSSGTLVDFLLRDGLKTSIRIFRQNVRFISLLLNPKLCQGLYERSWSHLWFTILENGSMEHWKDRYFLHSAARTERLLQPWKDCHTRAPRDQPHYLLFRIFEEGQTHNVIITEESCGYSFVSPLIYKHK